MNWSYMKYLSLLLLLCACDDAFKVDKGLREYIIKCPVGINEPSVTDTIVTEKRLWFLKTVYRIDARYYPSNCIIKSRPMNEDH